MQNLASNKYNPDIDKAVKEELDIADIPYLNIGQRVNSEVPTNYIGILNGFVFTRAWTYWVVTGYMPLDKAEMLYDEFAELNIRPGGHAGNIPPNEITTIKPCTEINKLTRQLKDKSISKEDFEREYKLIEETKEKFISVYHIDTLLGLKTLAKFIVNNNITTEFVNP